MKKIIFSMVLSLTLLASALSISASAAKITINSIDDKAAVLEGIGIIDSSVNEEALTNLQVASYLLKIFNISPQESDIFDYAKSCNILDADDNPDEELSYNMLCKMTVSAMGYDIDAELRGGYPKGYVSVAESKKLLKNVTANNDGSADRDDVINMLYNMLEVKMSDREFIYDFPVYDGTPLDVMGITKAEGTVTAIKNQTMMGDSVYADGVIAIDSVLYKYTAKMDLTDLFARKVVYYYDNENNEILHIYADKDGALTVDASMIDEYTYKNGIFNVKYSDLRETKFKFKAIPKYVAVNGEKVSNPNDLKKVLDIDYGTITAIDYDDNDTYDVLLVEKYDNYSVDFKGTKSIYDTQTGKQFKFCFDDRNYSYQFIKGGEEITFDEIPDKCVWSVYEYGGGKNVKVYISESSVYGELEQREDMDNGKTKLIIEGFPYYTVLDMGNIALGDTTTFYLDINGNIAGYDAGKAVKNVTYGYLVKLYKDETDNIGAKIFTRDQGMLNLTTENSTVKVTYKGKTQQCSFDKMEQDYPTVFETVDSKKEFKPQLVQFVAQGDTLKKLVFAAEQTADNEDQSYFKSVTSGNMTYGRNKIGNYIVEGGAEGASWIVAIPPDSEMGKDTKYTSNYTLSEQSTYNCTIYDTDDFLTAGVCVVKLNSSERVTNNNAVDKGLSFVVVDEIKLVEEYDEEEDEIKKSWRVTMGDGGKVVTYKLRYQQNGMFYGEMGISNGDVQADARLIDTNIDNHPFLNTGDVGQIAVDEFGYIVAFRKIYDYANDWMTNKFSGEYLKGYNIAPGFRSNSAARSTFGYGVVTNISDKYIVIECSNENYPKDNGGYVYTGKGVYPLNNKIVGHIYNSSYDSNKVEPADIKDVCIGDKILFNYVEFSFASYIILR